MKMINQKDSSAEPKTQVTSEACTQCPMEAQAESTRDISEMLLIPNQQLMEEILDRKNLKAAYIAVKRNKGCPGVDCMTVYQLQDHIRATWSKLRLELMEGIYKPQPVLQVEIPKPDGKGMRKLQIPTVQDRFILQAINQVLQRYIDPTFSEHSYGFRPAKSAIEAIKKSKEYVEAGYTTVVDIDLEKFFDRVNHDKLMSELYRRIKDVRLLKLIRSFLNAGALCRGLFTETTEGTSQGSPLSPLLSNLMLDLLAPIS